MSKLFSKSARWAFLVLAVIAGSSCSRVSSNDVAATSVRAALTTSNGLNQNGLTTNGLMNNGFWNNGFWNNGFWNNGFWNNGFWNNGFWNNGFWNNGFWNNGFWNNGFWNNGFWNNGLDGTLNVQGEVLRTNPYARELLQYIYSCAMPADGYDTTLDPNQAAPILCTPPAGGDDSGTSADGGTGDDGGTGCGAGYACSSEGNCVIPLKGGGANGSGLAINADGTTWWNSGTCDESCQRWISACVLARTNAYGVHVQISMRAPANAPQAIKDALAVTDIERNGADAGTDAGGDAGSPAFSLREGAYYGNIFATTPVLPDGGASPPPDAGADGGAYSGPATGPIASTPQFYACAGPGSNIPEITKRFCSSQGDQSVINVPGICLATSAEAGTCAGEDTDSTSPTFGAVQDCHIASSTNSPGACAGYRDPSCYSEVITVYLKDPISVCGNAVCEAGESSSTSPGYCPSDCHPGTWAVTLPNEYQTGPGSIPLDNELSAVGPDDSILFAGAQFGGVDLGHGSLPASGWAGILAKFSSGGDYEWGIRFANGLFNVSRVVVDANGTILVAGNGFNASYWIGTFAPDGTPITSWALPNGAIAERSIAFDPEGNIIVAGRFSGSLTIGQTTLVAPGIYSTVVAKYSPSGVPYWAVALGGPGVDTPTSLAVDPSGNVLLTAQVAQPSTSPRVYKLSATSGAVLWSLFPGVFNTPYFNAVAADANGDVYVTGSGPGPFLAKYHADGTHAWSSNARTVCKPGVVNCLLNGVAGVDIRFDGNGSVIVGSWGGVGTTPNVSAPMGIDFGVGTFFTYEYQNIFLAAYAPDSGALRWAKQVPIILNNDFLGMDIDSKGRAVLSGRFAGSMQVDDRLLVTDIPEELSDLESFIGSFATPSLLDTTPPVMSNVPQNIVTEATSSAGAVVFFMPPTAVDDGDAGTSVACVPRPNTTFPIGTTTVICTASDPLGNRTTESFTVTVEDTTAPIFSAVASLSVQAASAASLTVTTATDQANSATDATCTPTSAPVSTLGAETVTCSASAGGVNIAVADARGSVLLPVANISVQATRLDGATVSFPALNATDQVDGVVPVVCLPASGSLFPIGSSTVSCAATDSSNNVRVAKFDVNVTAVSGLSSAIGQPCSSTSQCATGTCVDGICCNTKSCDQCYACNVPGALGTCTPTSGGACNDHSACTQTDTCQAGACIGSNPVSCAPMDACHLAGSCDMSSGTCSNPVAPPTLNPATDQTVVGTCSSAFITYVYPTVANSCSATVTCTSIPGNSYGAHAVSCIATGPGGTSAPVPFTVIVLPPLTIKIQPPLSGDNDTVDNVVKDGSTVPNKILLYTCGVDVTATAHVVAKLGVAYKSTGGSSTTSAVATFNGIGDTGGVMVFDGTYYHYNLSTTGFSSTSGVPGFYQETITVAYQSAPSVIVGTDAIQVDTK
jgi:hypothetical protein